MNFAGIPLFSATHRQGNAHRNPYSGSKLHFEGYRGALDIGTSKAKLAVVEYDDHNPRHILRIHQDSFKTEFSDQDTEQSVRQKLSQVFSQSIEALRGFGVTGPLAQTIETVATHYFRVSDDNLKADEKEKILESVAQENGLSAKAIDGDTEARYSFVGAVMNMVRNQKTDIGDLYRRNLLVLDLGAGSIEVSLGQGLSQILSGSSPIGLSTFRRNLRLFSERRHQNLLKQITDALDHTEFRAIPDPNGPPQVRANTLENALMDVDRLGIITNRISSMELFRNIVLLDTQGATDIYKKPISSTLINYYLSPNGIKHLGKMTVKAIQSTRTLDGQPYSGYAASSLLPALTIIQAYTNRFGVSQWTYVPGGGTSMGSIYNFINQFKIDP